MVIFPMTLTGPNNGFQGHHIFDVKYIKNGAFRDKVTENTNRNIN